jgi:hypothetical protein
VEVEIAERRFFVWYLLVDSQCGFYVYDAVVRAVARFNILGLGCLIMTVSEERGAVRRKADKSGAEMSVVSEVDDVMNSRREL